MFGINQPETKRTPLNRKSRNWGKFLTWFRSLKRFANWKTAILIVGLGILYLFFTSSIFYVSDIGVTKINNKKFISETQIFGCTKQFLGKNIFYLQNSDVVKAIEGCSVIVRNVKVNKVLPSQITIEIDEIEPVVKFTTKDGCYLVDDKVFVKKIPQDECIKYIVPEIKNVPQADNPFLFSSIVRIIIASQNARLELPTAYEIILEGQSPFVIATYSTHTVIFSPDIPPDIYVTQYANTIKGLTDRKETFQQIDFRFDRVIVR